MLDNLIFDAAETSSSLLSNTDVVINGGAIFVADAIGTPVQTSDFTFNGGTLRVGQIEAGNNTGAKLAVSGDINIDSASTIELEGVKLEGTQNILAADQGVEQTIATYTGAVSSNLDALKVSGVGTSEIRNNSSDADPAAYGKWSTGALTAESGKLDVRLTLEEIQLADTDVGLKLDATGLTGDTTITAKITDYEKTAGKIVFNGGKDDSITIANSNDYHGVTVVEGGTVIVAADSGFGNTSELDISAGAVVNLQGYDQTVGRLVIGSSDGDATNALRGTGTLTLASGGDSEIWGTNNFGGTIVLGSGHDLALNNASGIGASAKVDLSAADSVLTIEGAKSGTFGTELLGSGTVVIRDSSIAVADGNTNFKGKWEIQSDAGVTVSDNVDAVLGTGAVVALDGTLTLGFASSSATDVTIDEKLSGSGSLVLTGANNQRFGLAGSGSDFNGTVALNQIGMTVGCSGTGANNSEAFKDADLVLQSGSVLEVATGSTVTTFDKVSVNNGQTAGFKFGGLGFNSDGTTASGTSALVINELVNNGAAQITLDALGTNGDLLGAVAETSLVKGGVDVFQALIQTGKVMDESILNNFTLTGVGTGQATQEIKSATEQVATGYYDFDLALGDSGTDLGVSYDLTRIDISGGKTLTLYEEGTLDAQLTSESGSGNLTIAAGGKSFSPTILRTLSTAIRASRTFLARSLRTPVTSAARPNFRLARAAITSMRATTRSASSTRTARLSSGRGTGSKSPRIRVRARTFRARSRAVVISRLLRANSPFPVRVRQTTTAPFTSAAPTPRRCSRSRAPARLGRGRSYSGRTAGPRSTSTGPRVRPSLMKSAAPVRSTSISRAAPLRLAPNSSAFRRVARLFLTALPLT